MQQRDALREDNADRRLTPVGRSLGVVDDERWRDFEIKRNAITGEESRLGSVTVRPGDVPDGHPVGSSGRDVKALELLRRHDVRYDDVVALERVGSSAEVDGLDGELREQVAQALETGARYAGYVERQRREIERSRRQASTPLPPDFDYGAVRGLSNEAREQLERVRPADVGQASRIAGITPAAVSLLLIHLKKRQRQSA